MDTAKGIYSPSELAEAPVEFIIHIILVRNTRLDDTRARVEVEGELVANDEPDAPAS